MKRGPPRRSSRVSTKISKSPHANAIPTPRVSPVSRAGVGASPGTVKETGERLSSESQPGSDTESQQQGGHGSGNADSQSTQTAGIDVSNIDIPYLNTQARNDAATLHGDQSNGRTEEDSTQPERVRSEGGSRLSRRRISRNAGHRSDVSNGDSIVTTDGHSIRNLSPGREQQLQVRFNRVKVELLEALRDKKAYSSALIAVKEQKDTIDKEMHILRQRNTALEAAMRISSKAKNGKKAVWSMENLRDTNIATYQGICLAAGDLAKREAKLVTTETYVEGNKNGLRKRNWTGSSTVVNFDTAKACTQYVVLPDGTFAIPTSCMRRAVNREHYISPFGDEKGFAKYCIRKILSSPAGSMMSDEEKSECQTLILAHRQTIRKFKAVLSDTVGNRKKSTLNAFLRSLGYVNGMKPNSDKLSSSQKAVRAAERGIIYDKCAKLDENGCDDTMCWRLSTWSSICLDKNSSNINCSEMEEAENKMEREGAVDTLFLNEAARRAFNELRGYQVCDEGDAMEADVSILSLARADAAMTTMIKWIKVEGRGGARNSNYNDCFRELLPSALEAIIKEIWDDLKDLVPNELVSSMQSIQSSSVDEYGNDNREWTCVIKNPEDNYLYLLAKPVYFKKKICSWLGCVKDCQIGRCLPNESTFTRIDKRSIRAEFEESDVEGEDGGNSPIENVIVPSQ